MIRFSLICAVLAIACTLASVPPAHAGSVAASAPSTGASGKVCQEDERCWRWSTMGNLRRGVILRNGKRAVVSVCGFQRLHLSRSLNITNPVMRGDSFALRYGNCPVQNY